MAKFTIAFAVCVALVVLNCDSVRSVSDEEMEKLTESCKIQEKATDEDIRAWKNGVVPQTKIVKCLGACMGEKMGMLIDNKLNIDAVMKVVQSAVNGTKTADYKTTVDDCKSITDQDRCEASEKICNCLNAGARNKGLKELF